MRSEEIERQKEKESGEKSAKRKKSDDSDDEDDDRRILVIFRPHKHMEGLWAPLTLWYNRGPLTEQQGSLSEKQAPFPIVRKWEDERRR